MSAQYHEQLVDELLNVYQAMIKASHASSAPTWQQLDLTLSQIKALFLLSDAHDLTVGGLAEKLRVGRPAASILVEVLVEHGYVERIEDRADRRRTFVRLTSPGSELITQLLRGQQEFLRAWFDRLDDDDLASMIRLFQTLMTTLPQADPAVAV
jgi:DNA-binding MarR family transcriptional regulator